MHTELLEFYIDNNCSWVNNTLMDANIPEEVLVVMIKRKGEIVIPKGSSTIKSGDTLVLAANNHDILNNMFK